MKSFPAYLRKVTSALSPLYAGTHVPDTLMEESFCSVMDVLVATMLSQATTDKNSLRAFQKLKARFPSWEMVLSAPLSDVAECIREAGLHNEKAERIRNTLEKVRSDTGCLDLEHLRYQRPEDAYRYLLSLLGVGPKTAACVMLFGLGRPAFPVDTHVFRVLGRLTGHSLGKSREAMQRAVESEIDPEICRDLHVFLIKHGRKICLPRNPRCSDCPLTGLCEEHNTRERSLSPNLKELTRAD
ncbi:MAG: endonuclease III [Bacillota bacterium]